jgi:hypothetical protein
MQLEVSNTRLGERRRAMAALSHIWAQIQVLGAAGGLMCEIQTSVEPRQGHSQPLVTRVTRNDKFDFDSLDQSYDNNLEITISDTTVLAH